MTPVTVPESKAQIAIATANLRNLPAGAVFFASSGQASVSVAQRGDTVYVDATCDSLQLLCWTLEKELVRIRNDTEQIKEEVKVTSKWAYFKWAVIGFACGVILATAAYWVKGRVFNIKDFLK